MNRLCKLLQIASSIAALVIAPAAYASFLPPEMMDTMATYVAWFVVIFVPIGAIVLFWMVHVLPEKIAEKRHHPQKDAIHTLCLLSLVFGGLGIHKAGRVPACLWYRQARGLLPRAGRQGEDW